MTIHETQFPLLTALLFAPLASFAAPERPNVPFICTDPDPAYADVLARHRQYLGEWVETNRDKLAAAYIIK